MSLVSPRGAPGWTLQKSLQQGQTGGIPQPHLPCTRDPVTPARAGGTGQGSRPPGGPVPMAKFAVEVPPATAKSIVSAPLRTSDLSCTDRDGSHRRRRPSEAKSHREEGAGGMGRSRGETQPHGREARGHQRPGRLLQAPRRGDGPALTTGVSAPRRKPGNVWAEEKPGPAWWGRRLEPKAWLPAVTTPFAGRVASGPRQAPSPVSRPARDGSALGCDAILHLQIALDSDFLFVPEPKAAMPTACHLNHRRFITLSQGEARYQTRITRARGDGGPGSPRPSQPGGGVHPVTDEAAKAQG